MIASDALAMRPSGEKLVSEACIGPAPSYGSAWRPLMTGIPTCSYELALAVAMFDVGGMVASWVHY